jgi:hypothetical protein
MNGGKKVSTRARYHEAAPDVSETGIGKCYCRFRMFFSRKGGGLELIEDDYRIRAPTPQETEQFRKDLTAAAAGDRKVAKFLDEFPALVFRAAEPQAEGPAGG